MVRMRKGAPTTTLEQRLRYETDAVPSNQEFSANKHSVLPDAGDRAAELALPPAELLASGSEAD
jgi:hypothetical protein